ncbi:MAG: DegT/DnrJ/EryC1/StrS family aminotransferase [Bryobacteraceae bacterium]
MRIPPVNFRALLDATETAWRPGLEALLARQMFILGPELEAFERDFAASTGAPHAIGVGSGSAAIELCLRHAGIVRPNQEVLTSALTAPFTGVAIAAAGCRPRFADVDPETLLLDPADAARRITRRTAAIVPVHLYGQPCDMAAFRRLAKAASAALIQDACQAHGVTWNGHPLTRYSPYVCYSFYPTKNLGALGDAGAIATASRSTNTALRMMRDGGRRPGTQIAQAAGINSRLDEMQAVFLRAFLPHLNEWNAHRRHIASLYDAAFESWPGVRLVRTAQESVRHLYVIRVHRRDRVRAALAAQGIGAGVHYPEPLHTMPAFRDCGLKRGDLPNAERATREVLSLPLWPYMPEAMAEEVAAAVREAVKRA